MNSHSRIITGVAAIATGLISAQQLLEHAWLRGSTGLAVTGTLVILATDLADRSQSGKWLAYGLLAVAFVLLGIRMFGG
jgi:hypothetical protein